MRRRDKYKTENKDTSKKPEIVVRKGQCPKCLKVVGQGITFHVKYCKG